MDSRNEWRERMKEKRREHQQQRRAELAADPRVQAMKQALKERRHADYERAKAWRKQRAKETKQREGEHAIEERARRDAALKDLIRPATTPDEER